MRQVALLCVSVGCLSITALAWGQDRDHDISSLISKAFTRMNEEKTAIPISEELLAEKPQEALDVLRGYEQDESGRVRHFAYTMVWQIGHTCADPRIRQQVTARLAGACGDPDPLVWQHASKQLLSFKEADFSHVSRQVIRSLLTEDTPRSPIVRVVGAAGMRDELPRLKSLLIDESEYDSDRHGGKWYGTVGWAARLARARLGVQEDVLRAIKLVELEDHPVVRVTVLLRDLGYIRRPAAIEAIRAYLESEERLPQIKKSGPGTKYAQYAMDVLGESIPNFPVKKKYIGAYTQAEIDRCREWMKNRRE